MEWKKGPEDLVEFIAQKTANFNCDFRKMFGYPAYFVNGNMFTGLYGDRLFIRLSETGLKKIVELNLGVKPFEPMPGRIMKGYVVLPQSFYCNDKLFDEWLEHSFKFASSLPPKKPKPKGKS
jgi:TfoX/Sxy family transcriptional regulator of competence genes